MEHLSPTEIGAVVIVAALAIKEAFAFARSRQSRDANGKMKASVKPEDAPEFYLMQRQMLEILQRLDREILDDEVKRHHRESR